MNVYAPKGIMIMVEHVKQQIVMTHAELALELHLMIVKPAMNFNLEGFQDLNVSVWMAIIKVVQNCIAKLVIINAKPVMDLWRQTVNLVILV